MARPGLSFEVVRPRETIAVRADRAGIAALMQRGPADRLVAIASAEALDATFGAPVDGMLGARAAAAFFDNGGAELRVARVVPPSAAPASGLLPLLGVGSAMPAPAIAISLAEPGAFGDEVRLRPRLRRRARLDGTVSVLGDALTPALGPPSLTNAGLPVFLMAGGATAWSTITGVSGGAYVLSPSRPAVAGSVIAETYGRAFDLVVEEPGRADLIVAGIDLWAPDDVIAARLAESPVRLSLPGTPVTDLPVPDPIVLTGGNDGIAIGSSPLEGAFARAFDLLDASPDVDIVIAPDLWSGIWGTKGVRRLALDESAATALGIELVARAARRRDRIALVDPPLRALEPLAPSELLSWRATLDTTLGEDRDFGAAYAPWPRVVVDRTYRGDNTMLVPPSAFVAGRMARTALDRGAWIATGGVALTGAFGLSQAFSVADEELLGDVGINPLRVSSAGVTIEGVRSLAYPDRAAWRFVTARRLFNYLRRALEPLGLSYVFEPNAPATWIQLRRDIEAMLRDLFARGALAGSQPRDAFFVRVDGDLNPEAARDAGVLTAQIGVAPAAPLEFIVVSLVLRARESGPEVSIAEAR